LWQDPLSTSTTYIGAISDIDTQAAVNWCDLKLMSRSPKMGLKLKGKQKKMPFTLSKQRILYFLF
jgi:hypothetical protein